MALPRVTINVTGSINRPSLNTDGISGFCFYNDYIADLTTFTSTDNIIKFTNLAAIEATGITSTSTHFKNEHYQLSEFFRAGGVNVWIGIFDVPATYDFAELDTMRLTSNGEIKIYATFLDKDLISADLAAFNSKIVSFEAFKKPAIGVFASDIHEITLSGLPDLRNLAAQLHNVSCVIGQDTENVGLSLTTSKGASVPDLGIVVGTLAQSKVSENILYIGKYNYTNGSILLNPGLYLEVSGLPQMINISDINETDLDILNDKGYIFWRFMPNFAGTYLSNDNNCAKITETFNSIHIVRVRNKAIRELDSVLTPLIGSSVLFNANGTMRQSSITVFQSAAASALQAMKDNLEISDYSIYIDPSKNVLSTKQVELNASIIPVESADNISININFTQSL